MTYLEEWKKEIFHNQVTGVTGKSSLSSQLSRGVTCHLMDLALEAYGKEKRRAFCHQKGYSKSYSIFFVS